MTSADMDLIGQLQPCTSACLVATARAEREALLNRIHESLA
jgi:hypothetical protein